MAALCAALDTDAPRYASGTPVIPVPRSRVSRVYGRFWQTLPFLTQDAPGFGLFAVNAAGRARWAAFPDIISDDTFVRLQFAPSERMRLEQTYLWPLVEGFAPLVACGAGKTGVSRKLPNGSQGSWKTIRPASPRGMGVARRALRDPIGFCVYAGVALTVRTRIFARKAEWDRGR